MQPSPSLAQCLPAPRPGFCARRRIETVDARADGRRRVVVLGPDRIEIARCIAGVFMCIALRPSAFRGVVLRLDPAGEADFRYEVRLEHVDPDLNVTLFEAGDDSEVQAEWRLWARFLGLPLLVERRANLAEPDAPRLGGVLLRPTAPRRRGKILTGRRARFLVRRKPGRAQNTRHEAAELFPGATPGR